MAAFAMHALSASLPAAAPARLGSVQRAPAALSRPGCVSLRAAAPRRVLAMAQVRLSPMTASLPASLPPGPSLFGVVALGFGRGHTFALLLRLLRTAMRAVWRLGASAVSCSRPGRTLFCDCAAGWHAAVASCAEPLPRADAPLSFAGGCAGAGGAGHHALRQGLRVQGATHTQPCTRAAWAARHHPPLANAPSSLVQVRRILDVIRGRDYQQAVMMLEFLPHRAAKIVRARCAVRDQVLKALSRRLHHLLRRPLLTPHLSPRRSRTPSCRARPTPRTRTA
jgi:hypothetical protein